MSASSQDGGQDTGASLINWNQISAYLSQVATDHAFDLPPQEEDLSFLRLCYVLATLCHAAYLHKQPDVGSASSIELPLMGRLHDTAVVKAQLIHFREAEVGQDLASPQQYGIWRVEGLGLVVAFRGTASSEDVFIDANIAPIPLASEDRVSAGSPVLQDCLKVHRGFYEGAKQHANAIVRAILESNGASAPPLPVWIIGHSLGGAYANCLMLHLLETRSTARLFVAGGGSVTFGAPMVVHATNSAAAYKQLEELESFAEAQLRDGTRLQFHNFVNNADIVPRLLGTSLDSVHEAVESYITSMKSVRQLARHYHPFGAYHLILGSQVRTLKLPGSQRQGFTRLGNTEYAAEVNRQLNMSRIWKSVYATSGKGAGVTHHSIMSYQERLITHMSSLARQVDSLQLSDLSLGSETASANMTSLFLPSPESRPRSAASTLNDETLDVIGKALGTAAQAAASQLGSSAYIALTERWNRGAAASASEEASSSEKEAPTSATSSWTSRWLGSRGSAASAANRGNTDQQEQPTPEQQSSRSSWFTSSRWNSPAEALPAETPPQNWRDLGSAVGVAFTKYMQSPSEGSQQGESRRARGQREL